jgi:Protein of unknown function (DUF4232)
MGGCHYITRLAGIAAAGALSMLGLAVSPSWAAPSLTSVVASTAAPVHPSPGYQLIASDGGVFNEHTPFFGSLGNSATPAPVVGGVPTASGNGYWLVDAAGDVTAFGDALHQGSIISPLNSPIVGMAADPATGGYWLVASDGGVFSFNAPFQGSTGNLRLNKPVVGIVPTTAGPLAPACATRQLSIAVHSGGVGLGHVGYVLEFTNNGSTCSLAGYPAVRGEENGTVTFQATPTPAGYLGGIKPDLTPSPVTLASGRSASALLEGIDFLSPGNNTCPVFTTISVTPPNNAQSVSLPPPPLLCSPQQIHPVVPGTSGRNFP